MKTLAEAVRTMTNEDSRLSKPLFSSVLLAVEKEILAKCK
jgi:hypothetical protein